MKLASHERLDIREVLRDLEHYRPRRKGWAWRTKTPQHQIGPFVFEDTSTSLAQSVPLPAPRLQGSALAGEVLKVDRFGNLITNLDAALLERCGCASPHVRIGGCDIRRLVQTYGETAVGDLCALFGSSGYLEVAVNGGSAAERLHAGRVRRARRGPGGDGQRRRVLVVLEREAEPDDRVDAAGGEAPDQDLGEHGVRGAGLVREATCASGRSTSPRARCGRAR